MRKAEAQARSTNNYTLLGYVQLLNQLSELKKETVKNEKKLIEVYNLSETIENLCSIPGIAFRSAVIILSELWDLKRFKTKAQLAAYVGLAPRVVGSGESEETVGAGNRKQKYLHYIFTEVAQRASRSDSEMASLYGKKIYQGLDNQQAVCVVAKKILFIIRAVCLDKRPYQVRLEKK